MSFQQIFSLESSPALKTLSQSLYSYARGMINSVSKTVLGSQRADKSERSYRLASGLMLLVAGSVSAYVSTGAIGLAQFAPDSLLNSYSVYGSDGVKFGDNFTSASGGNFGSGKNVDIGNGAGMYSPLFSAGGNFTLGNNPNDSAYRVLVNGNVTLTSGTIIDSVVQVRGTISTSGNPVKFRKAVYTNNLTTSGTSIFLSPVNVRGVYTVGGGDQYVGAPLNMGTAATYSPAIYSFNDNPDPVNPPGPIIEPYPAGALLRTDTQLPGYTIDGMINPTTEGTVPDVNAAQDNLAYYKMMTLQNTATGPSPNEKIANCAAIMGAEAATSCRGDTLVPGYYNNLYLGGNGIGLLLGEGVYSFYSVTMGVGGNGRLIATQPNGGRTVVYVYTDFISSVSGNLIAPEGGVNATAYGTGPGKFLGGTMMLITNGKMKIPSDLRVWATLSAPHDTMSFGTQLWLYGQAFAKWIVGPNTQFGQGAYIRFDPFKPVIQINRGNPVTIREETKAPCANCKDTTIYVTLSKKNAFDVTLKWELLSGDGGPLLDATWGTDFTTPGASNTFTPLGPQSGSLTIKSNTLSDSIKIRIKDDSSYNGDRVFRIRLYDPKNARFDTANGGDSTQDIVPVTILDDDSTIYVRLVPAVAPVAARSIERPIAGAPDTAFHFRLEVVDKSTGNVVNAKANFRVKLRLADVLNTGVIGPDLTLPLTYVNITAGQSVVDVRVVLKARDIYKPGIFNLILDSAYGAVRLDTLVTDTILSAASKLVIGNGTANQATDSVLYLPVQLVRISDNVPVISGVRIPFTWSTMDSTAKFGVHYERVSNVLDTFYNSRLLDSVRVKLIRNPLYDSTRYLKAELVPSLSPRLSTARDTGVGTILTGWDKPKISVSPATFKRPKADSVVKIPVSLDRAATFKANYSFASVNGGAVNGVDFTLAAGSSSISSTDSISVILKASNALDSTRHFYVIIPTWDANHLAKGDTVATITLTSAITNARVLVDSAKADQSKDSVVRFPVRLVDGSGSPISTRIDVPFSYTTYDLSAKAGKHFVGASGDQGTLKAGNGVDSFNIKLIRTNSYDSTRHFLIDVAALPGIAGLLTTHDSAVGTIVNGWARPTIHIDSASIARPKVKTDMKFRVWLDRPSEIDLPFSWSTRNGGAVADTDYIGVDTTATTIKDTVLLPVSVLARPGEYDTTRHFHVDLSKLSAFANSSATALGGIVPSIGAPYLWVRPASVDEGPAGKDTLMVFKVDLRDSTGAAMTSRLTTTFTWGTVPDYAGNGVDSLARSVPYSTFPADFAAMSGATGTVPVLSNTGTFSVVVHGNDIKQPDRVLQVRIGGATYARLDSTGSRNVGTILDDDSISRRAFFPVERDTVGENVSIAWVPVALTKKANFPDTLVVTVNSRTTALVDTNFVLLQPAQSDIRDTTKVPTGKTGSVRLVIQPGDSLLWFPVRIRHDSVRTNDLRIILDLAVVNPWDVKVDPGRAQTELVVVNVDPPPYLGFRDTAMSIVRGQTGTVRVGVHPLRSDKDPSAQYTGTITGPSDAKTPAWADFVKTAREGSTPTFTRMDFDTSFPFATIDDGRDGPDLRVVLRMHDWTPGEAIKPLPGDPLLRDSVVIWIRNSNAVSKASFWTDSVTVRDVDGEVSVKVLLDKSSNWNTGVSVTRTGEAADVYLAPDSSVKLSWKPGDSVATFVLKYGNNHKVGSDRVVKLHLGSFIHLVPGRDSVLTIRIVNTNKNPVVKITSPKEGAELGKKDLDSLGKVPVTWTVDGNKMTPYDTLIPEGPGVIVKCYADQWGNVGCDSIHVTLDTTPPVVVITHVSQDGGKTWLVVSPTDTPWVNKTNIQVKWISIDNKDTTRHQDGETLRDSINKIVRCIEDRVGNKGCGSGLVGLDTIPPKVWIVNPPDQSHWAAGCISMVWFEKDDSTKRHDSLVCFKTTGPHTITVSSKPDRAGNVGTASTTIYIDPNEPGKATYVDTDNDGRIDAVVVQFPRNWTDSMPYFDVSYGGPGKNTVDSIKGTYGTKSQAGTEMVYNGETIRVQPGIAVKDSAGKPVKDSSGKVLYQSPGGTPLLDKDGKQVVDGSGAPLWKVVGTGVDSSVVVLKLSPEFPYGWTSSTIDSLGAIHAVVTFLNDSGKVVTRDMNKVFDIYDGVPPVIVSAKTVRTEDYDGRDVLTIVASEPLVFDSTGKWLEIKVNGKWTKVPAESLQISDDGKTITILLPPGEEGVPDPGVEIRFLDGVTDSAGNRVPSKDRDWSVVVEGPPRPPLLDVDVVKPIGTISQEEQNRTRKPGFVITATNGGDNKKYDPWRPGEGYLGSSGDQEFRDVCPNVDDCNGLEIEVNHPMRVQVYVYDLLGTHAGGFSFELTQQDLDDLNPDKLDRYRIRILWNQRGQDGRVVSSGIYPWRVVSWVHVNPREPPVLTNRIVKLGVKSRLE